MVYKWKTGTRLAADANVAGQICEDLEKQGNLTASNLVDVSRDEDAPLHKCFTWDDSIAAEKYRCQEARHIINSLEIVVVESKPPVRSFLNIEVASPKYERTEVILSNVDKRQKMLEMACSEMRTFKVKYQSLSELADVFEAMDDVLQTENKEE